MRSLTKAEKELLGDALLSVKFRAEADDENLRLAKRATRLWQLLDYMRMIRR
jgi:hypothetical protein